MRLVTHNLLICNLESCATRNFPLAINASEISEGTQPYNQDLALRMVTKID